jgi:hypothetical protein
MAEDAYARKMFLELISAAILAWGVWMFIEYKVRGRTGDAELLLGGGGRMGADQAPAIIDRHVFLFRRQGIGMRLPIHQRIAG